MPTVATTEIHPNPTDHHGYRYQFTPKHHGADRKAAQWLPEMTLNNEFAVFNLADQHDLFDDRGWLYGIWQTENGLADLGSWAQQIAEFPFTREGHPWHGYPIWPLSEHAPGNRRGENMRPEKDVFMKMERTGLLTSRERKRLNKGDHI